MIKTILFDLGEVFFTVDLKKVNEDMVRKTGVPIKPSVGRHYRFYVDFVAGKITTEEYFDNLRKAVNSDAPVPLLYKTYSDAYTKHSKINQNMLTLAQKLRNNYRLICVTNTNQLHKQINQTRGLFSVFDSVFSSTESKRLKDTSWFKDILAELKINASECIFTDDLIENVEAARAAGIDSIQFINCEMFMAELSKRNIKF